VRKAKRDEKEETLKKHYIDRDELIQAFRQYNLDDLFYIAEMITIINRQKSVEVIPSEAQIKAANEDAETKRFFEELERVLSDTDKIRQDCAAEIFADLEGMGLVKTAMIGQREKYKALKKMYTGEK
jgi:hypothetical protein